MGGSWRSLLDCCSQTKAQASLFSRGARFYDFRTERYSRSARPEYVSFPDSRPTHSQIGKIAHLFQILCTCEQFPDMHGL